MRFPGKYLAAAIVVAAMGSVPAAFGQMAPFGNDEDIAFADKVWSIMQQRGVAGVDDENTIRGFPYEGTEPHGFVLDTLYLKANIDGRTGDLVVKRNYGPEGVTVEEVQADAAGHLAAITIAFKREAGYDEEDANWFWAKYLADGTLDKNASGLALAGRVAKGMDAGCIACHTAAGEDMLFTTDHIK